MTYQESVAYLQTMAQQAENDPDGAKKEFVNLLVHLGVMFPPSQINDEDESWE